MQEVLNHVDWKVKDSDLVSVYTGWPKEKSPPILHLLPIFMWQSLLSPKQYFLHIVTET
jgi:hypothetical protein